MNPCVSDALPRVCMLLESFHPIIGGMETQARNMARGFVQAGIGLFILTRRIHRDLPAEEKIDNVPVVRVGPAGVSSRLRWALALSCIPELIRRRREYDIILVPGFRALGISAVVVSKLLRKKCVLKAESSGEMSGQFFAGGLEKVRLKLESWPVRAAVKARNWLLARADAFASLSADQTAEFTMCGVPPSKIVTIPQSVQTDRFRPALLDEKIKLRAALGLPKDSLIVAYTGRIVSYKGLPLLVEIWPDIRGVFPEALLLAVGAGGADVFNCEAEVRARAEQLGLQDAVRFTGAVQNVEDYLRAADLYALPTQNEAFPLALLEAMACGLACISTPVGGIPDILRHGENGWLVPPGDRTALREAVLHLARDPALRARLGEAALNTARSQYAREIITERYAELFRRLTKPG